MTGGFALGSGGSNKAVSTSMDTALSLGQGTAKIGAAALQAAHSLFIAYARLATVAIIENSVEDTPVSMCTPTMDASTESSLGTEEKVASNSSSKSPSQDPTEALVKHLPVSSTTQPDRPQVGSWILSDTIGGKHFLRNYLRAFPLSLRKDLALTQSTRASVDPHDPIQVIRRKLWHMFLSETSSSTLTLSTNLVSSSHQGSVEQQQQQRGTATNALVQDALHELVLLARGPWRLLPCGLQAGPAVQFSKIWSDKLTKVKEVSDPLYRGKRTEERVERESSISIYRPFADSGFSILGDVAITASTSIGKVAASVLVVSDDDGYAGKTLSADGMPLLARPVGYEVIWRDVGLEANQHVTLWRPIPPEGYVALGCVAIEGRKLKSPEEDSSLSQLRCVHRTCVTSSVFRDGLWSFEPPSAEEAAALAAAEEEMDPTSRSSKYPKTTRLPQGVSLWGVMNEAQTFIPRAAPLSATREEESGRSNGDGDTAGSSRYDGGKSNTDSSSRQDRSLSPSQRSERDPLEMSSRTLPLFDLAGDGDEQDSSRSGVGGLLRMSVENSNGKNGEASGLVPLHLGAVGNQQGDGTGSPELALWILQLLSEFDTTHGFLEQYSSKVFSEQMLYAVLRFSRTANTEAFRIKALRMAATVIRRAPLSAFTRAIRQDLVSLKEFMEDMHARQIAAGP
jgi:hypothetical protein